MHKKVFVLGRASSILARVLNFDGLDLVVSLGMDNCVVDLCRTLNGLLLDGDFWYFNRLLMMPISPSATH